MEQEILQNLIKKKEYHFFTLFWLYLYIVCKKAEKFLSSQNNGT